MKMVKHAMLCSGVARVTSWECKKGCGHGEGDKGVDPGRGTRELTSGKGL